MKVLLVNIDSKLPNLALHKIAMYHEDLGDNVTWGNENSTGIWDKVYVSCLFTFNREKLRPWIEHGAIAGGTGWDLNVKLPVEIEAQRPKLNLGFTMRGCIRQCEFCVVPRAEGGVHAVGDIYDLWDGQSKELALFDNNILAIPHHFEKIAQQLIKENLRVDFNQGLDVRLFNETNARILKQLRLKVLRFSYDNSNYKDKVLAGIELYREHKLPRPIWYVYTDGNYPDVKERLDLLRANGQRCFLMRNTSLRGNKLFILLARWVNMQGYFIKYTLKEFSKFPANKYYEKYCPD